MAYEHCEVSKHERHGSRFRFVWDYRTIKPHMLTPIKYSEWVEYCRGLKKFFERYPEVTWRCGSFEFVAQCDNLLWVAEQILHDRNGTMLKEVTGMQQFVPARGHVALTLPELLEIT